MVNTTRRYKHTIIKLCLTLSLVVFSAGALGGCATPSKNGRLQGNNSVTELFETQQFLPNHSYYYGGFQAIPYVIVGIDNRYTLKSSIWYPMKRDPDFNKGSMIYADGLILATDGAKSLYLIEPDPTEFNPLASAELLISKPGDERMAARFGSQNWAPIALADGKLLIRDQTRMMCLKVAE